MNPFRPATESDVDSILELMRCYYSEDGYAFVKSEARQAVSALIRDADLGRVWIAHDEGQVAGYLAVTLGFSLEYRGRDAFIDELFLEPGSRARGLGRKAIEIAESYCRELGVKALHLEVEHHREAALELYRRTGFKDHDRYLMTKRLDEAAR